jgi:two-component system, sensor histidine kinase and response regulator
MERAKSILVVDDKPTNLSLVTSLLRSHYQVFLANDGEKAIAIARDSHPDLILLDIMMPDLSGFEVCVILKQNESTSNIPIIFLTARTSDDDIDNAFSMGGVDYVTKPLRSKELLARIKTHLLVVEQRANLLQMNEETKTLNDNLELLVRQRTKDLQDALEAIEKRNRSLEQFSNIASHNLRGPVASILGLSNILNLEPPSLPTNRTIFESLVQKAEELDSVIKDMSAILEVRDDISSHFSIVGLEELLENGIKALRCEIEKSKVGIETSVPRGLKVFTVHEYLESIIIQLLANAVRYVSTERPPRILIKAIHQENSIVISIEDNGTGIRPENFDKIFEPYKRIASTGSGKGLGLYLVRRQAEALRGRIEVASEYGIGSIFSLSLPQHN